MIEQLEALEQQMTALQNLIAELKEDTKEEDVKPWEPEYGERYYNLSDIGEVENQFFIDTDWSRCLVNSLNVYKTREEAEFWAERLMVFRELSLFAFERVPKVDENDHVYSIEYDRDDGGCHIIYCRYSIKPPVVFESVETAQKAIDYVGEFRLKKYWFGV